MATLTELQQQARERLAEVEAQLQHLEKLQAEATILHQFIANGPAPDPTPAPARKLHWMQRPENAAKVRAMLRKSHATRRRHNGKRRSR